MSGGCAMLCGMTLETSQDDLPTVVVGPPVVEYMWATPGKSAPGTQRCDVRLPGGPLCTGLHGHKHAYHRGAVGTGRYVDFDDSGEVIARVGAWSDDEMCANNSCLGLGAHLCHTTAAPVLSSATPRPVRFVFADGCDAAAPMVPEHGHPWHRVVEAFAAPPGGWRQVGVADEKPPPSGVDAVGEKTPRRLEVSESSTEVLLSWIEAAAVRLGPSPSIELAAEPPRDVDLRLARLYAYLTSLPERGASAQPRAWGDSALFYEHADGMRCRLNGGSRYLVRSDGSRGTLCTRHHVGGSV